MKYHSLGRSPSKNLSSYDYEPRSRYLQGGFSLRTSLLGLQITFSLSLHWSSIGMCLCPNLFFLKGNSGLQHSLVTSPNLTYLPEGPLPERSHILRYLEFEIQHARLARYTIQPSDCNKMATWRMTSDTQEEFS